ncbi:MAG: PTS sugar transporter subunit IIC [Lachnospira sp.]|nr:PTS sugar transporter subunit IIC [Lachnospira sp.]
MIKTWLNRVFIDGLSGMAMGLFSTLIVGTIIKQIGTYVKYINGDIGNMLILIGSIASAATCAGIGVGVAVKYKESTLVVIAAAVAGMVGGYAKTILAGSAISGSVTVLAGPGEPLGAFIAAYIAIEFGHLVSGKTKVDILVTPIVSILTGSAIGLLVGPPIVKFMDWIGSIINYATNQHPFVMGILVSVIMGMLLTLPISSAAIGVALKLNGIAAGAAVIGCCCQMVGFAVGSYRENKFGGLVAQGIGTSMLQIPNIVKKPIIWLPAIVTSAILGPVSTVLLKMSCNAVGSGMGTAGLVGPLMTWEVMASTMPDALLFVEILLMYFLLPGAICFSITEGMRKAGWIKNGDMKLKL